MATVTNNPVDVPAWTPPPVTSAELEWADILTVDLSKFETNKDELVRTVDTALRRDGFFYAVGHGLATEKLKRQFSIGQLAFDAVTQEEKKQYRAPIAEQGSFIGYKLQKYWEIKDGVRDRIEHYNFYLTQLDPVTRHPQALRPYHEEVKSFLSEIRQKVLKRVLSLIDAVLGLESGYLWNLHEDDKGNTGDDLLRYMIYDPLTEEEAATTRGVMLNGHTDFNSISTLISQPISALQVLMPDNVWSGGILKGTMHRVVRPPPDQVHFRRLGVFHFAHFRHGLPLSLLPSRKVQDEGHKIFEGHTPTTDEWEATRVKSYGTATFIKGEEYDIEVIAGLQVRHYH
ncbi:hypothetical protein AX16_003834 [Volvariella volvacea WC 439]|nr:hypothetical protein AX16_003834 [Volvariella volvacea WC 439]